MKVVMIKVPDMNQGEESCQKLLRLFMRMEC